MPRGYTHWFENVGRGVLHYLVVFSSEEPIHVDIHEIVEHIPKAVLAKVWGIPESSLQGVPQKGSRATEA